MSGLFNRMFRVFLIHGYVEDSTIFDQLVALLPLADYVRLNLADEFARWKPIGPITVQRLAKYLMDAYAITDKDIVIGHSMGGWTAIHLKQLSGAVAIQLASWTDQRKIKFPVRTLFLLKLLTRSGLTQSRALTDFSIRQYPFAESRDLYVRLVEGMARMSRLYLWQQLQVLFAAVPSLTVQPDLRIHARPDNIVGTPNEPFIDVPGDHFSLIFHAEAVAEPIRMLLANRGAT